MVDMHYPMPYLLDAADAIVSDTRRSKAAKHKRTLAA
jgi:hypothetical protein